MCKLDTAFSLLRRSSGLPGLAARSVSRFSIWMILRPLEGETWFRSYSSNSLIVIACMPDWVSCSIDTLGLAQVVDLRAAGYPLVSNLMLFRSGILVLEF